MRRPYVVTLKRTREWIQTVVVEDTTKAAAIRGAKRLLEPTDTGWVELEQRHSAVRTQLKRS